MGLLGYRSSPIWTRFWQSNTKTIPIGDDFFLSGSVQKMSIEGKGVVE